MARIIETYFGRKTVELDVDDKGQAALFEAIIRYNSRSEAMTEALRAVARHAEREAGLLENGHQASGLGIFQSQTTIVDARAGELAATHEMVLVLASAIGFQL